MAPLSIRWIKRKKLPAETMPISALLDGFVISILFSDCPLGRDLSSPLQNTEKSVFFELCRNIGRVEIKRTYLRHVIGPFMRVF